MKDGNGFASSVVFPIFRVEGKKLNSDVKNVGFPSRDFKDFPFGTSKIHFMLQWESKQNVGCGDTSLLRELRELGFFLARDFFLDAHPNGKVLSIFSLYGIKLRVTCGKSYHTYRTSRSYQEMGDPTSSHNRRSTRLLFHHEYEEVHCNFLSGLIL